MKEVKGKLVSYLATAQRRAPSATREDRKRLLMTDLDVCDCSIALNHSDSFFGFEGGEKNDYRIS
jgi:hypothetical protein